MHHNKVKVTASLIRVIPTSKTSDFAHLDGHGLFDDPFGLVGPLHPNLVEALLDGAADGVVEVFNFVADLSRDPLGRWNDPADAGFRSVRRLDVLDELVEVLELFPRGPEDGGLGHVERDRVSTHAVSSRHLERKRPSENSC